MCNINRIISVSIGNRTRENKGKPQWVWTIFGALWEWDRIAGVDERRRYLEGKLHCTAMLA